MIYNHPGLTFKYWLGEEMSMNELFSRVLSQRDKVSVEFCIVIYLLIIKKQNKKKQ